VVSQESFKEWPTLGNMIFMHISNPDSTIDFYNT